MSEDNNNIHEFDLEMLRDYFFGMERQGPGSPEMTLKALSFIDILNEKSKIADIGCGTGGQTMILGQHAQGQIHGLDIFPNFIDRFNSNAKKLGLDKRVKGKIGSMDALSFEEEELDLIWSEGSIFIIGFKNGLEYWKKFLKPGGYIVISDACWFTSERPKEIQEFWDGAYPEIDTIPNKLAQMQDLGFLPIASFIQPEECWTKNFYDLHGPVQEAFLKERPGSEAAERFIEYQRLEADLYYKYKEYYGYAFFIGKKI